MSGLGSIQQQQKAWTDAAASPGELVAKKDGITTLTPATGTLSGHSVASVKDPKESFQRTTDRAATHTSFKAFMVERFGQKIADAATGFIRTAEPLTGKEVRKAIASGEEKLATAQSAKNGKAIDVFKPGEASHSELTGFDKLSGASQTKFDATMREELRKHADVGKRDLSHDELKAVAQAAVDKLKAAETDRVSSSGTEIDKCKPGGSVFASLKGADKLSTGEKALFGKLLEEELKADPANRDLALTADTAKKAAEKVLAQVAKLTTTKLSAEINALVKASPTLAENVYKLQRDGWSIRNTTTVDIKGSYCDKPNKTIVIDKNTTAPLTATGVLAHESGHAFYTKGADPNINTSTRTAYVDGCTRNCMLDEGEATLVACKVHAELVADGKGSIWVPGEPSTGTPWRDIYKQVVDGTKTVDQARGEFADGFGALIPSTDETVNYTTYYGRDYAESWDKAHPAPPPTTTPP